MNFFYWQALGRTQICLMVQQILGNFTEGNVTNFTWKSPIFFVAKHCVIEWKFAKIGILACVDFWIMGHTYSFCMFILDLQNSWTQALLDIGGPVFFSCSMKDNKVHTFKRSLQGILASIIEMLQYGKYNSHDVTQVIIVVKIKTIHIYHAYKINIPWGLVQMFVCQRL